MIHKGQALRFKAQWRDTGDEALRFIALEDEDGGRVRVEAQLGWPINPQSIVSSFMVVGH